LRWPEKLRLRLGSRGSARLRIRCGQDLASNVDLRQGRQRAREEGRGYLCGNIAARPEGLAEPGGTFVEHVTAFLDDHVAEVQANTVTRRKFSNLKISKLSIDLSAGNVVWERDDGLAPFATSQMVDYYMRTEKIGRAEAVRNVQQRPQLGMKQVTYRILHVQKGDTFVSRDPITQALPKEPRSMPTYTVTFGYGFGDSQYSLFVPDNGADAAAILSRYWADGISSWVTMRFGKCRVLK
jgi:hypothetical protein